MQYVGACAYWSLGAYFAFRAAKSVTIGGWLGWCGDAALNVWLGVRLWRKARR